MSETTFEKFTSKSASRRASKYHPMVSFRPGGRILINAMAGEFLGEHEFVELFFDYKNKAVGLKPTEPSLTAFTCHGKKSQSKHRQGRTTTRTIYAPDFIRKYGLECLEGFVFPAEWDDSAQMVTANVADGLDTSQNTYILLGINCGGVHTKKIATASSIEEAILEGFESYPFGPVIEIQNPDTHEWTECPLPTKHALAFYGLIRDKDPIDRGNYIDVDSNSQYLILEVTSRSEVTFYPGG